MTIYVFSFDFDGCIYNREYRRLENVISANRVLFDEIKEKIRKSDVTAAITFVGSNRQSATLDKTNSKNNATGSCFEDIKTIALYIGAELDKFLLADIYNNVVDGTSFNQARFSGALQYECWFDSSKVLFYMHRCIKWL